MKANRIFRILKWTAGIIISLVVLVDMKANRIFCILKWAAGIIISLVVLVAVATLLANSNYVQQQLLKKATSYLSERLGTNVKADSVSVNLFVPSMSLYGLDIEDQQKRPMLRMGEASARITIASIWEKSITIEHIGEEHHHRAHRGRPAGGNDYKGQPRLCPQLPVPC